MPNRTIREYQADLNRETDHRRQRRENQQAAAQAAGRGRRRI